MRNSQRVSLRGQGHRKRWPTVAALALLLAACGNPAAYPLPTRDPALTACGGVGMVSLVLHGSLSSGVARTWTADWHGSESTVYWPPGYVARFDPGLVVLDRSGAVRAREGDDLLSTGPTHELFACPTEGGSIVWIWDEPATSPSSSPANT
jgi:hypothetical protein